MIFYRVLAVVVTGITCLSAEVLDWNLFIKIFEIACVSLGLSNLTYSYSNYIGLISAWVAESEQMSGPKGDEYDMLTFKSVDESESATIQMKAIEQYVLVLQFITL